MVARGNRPRAGPLRRPRRAHPGFRDRPVHLHDLLMPAPAAAAGRSPPELRRVGLTVGGAFLVLALISAWRGPWLPPRALRTAGGAPPPGGGGGGPRAPAARPARPG